MQTTELLTVTVRVTWDDIEKGEASDCTRCPLARAINRLLRRGLWAAVDGSRFSILQGDWFTRQGLFCCEIPDHVGDWIENFDVCLEVEPISFPLDLPAEVLNEQAKAAAK